MHGLLANRTDRRTPLRRTVWLPGTLANITDRICLRQEGEMVSFVRVRSSSLAIDHDQPLAFTLPREAPFMCSEGHPLAECALSNRTPRQ